MKFGKIDMHRGPVVERVEEDIVMLVMSDAELFELKSIIACVSQDNMNGWRKKNGLSQTSKFYNFVFMDALKDFYEKDD